MSDVHLIGNLAKTRALNFELIEMQKELIRAISCVREIVVHESKQAQDDPRWQECVTLIDAATAKAVQTP